MENSSKKCVALTVISAIQFILLLDATVVNVALPKIKEDLGFNDSSLTWVVNSYLIAAGSLLLLGGKIGDAYGLSKTFKVGVLIFGIFSLVAAFSTTPIMLIISRTGQGVGEALASATGLAIVSRLFPTGPERSKAFAIWAALGGFGSIFGVLLSGILTEFLSWRWVFGINVPLIIVMYISILIFIPTFKSKHRIKLDLKNALLLVISVFILVLSIVGSGLEQLIWVRLILLILSVSCILFTLKRCKNSENGIIPARLMKKSPRVIGYIIVAILAANSGALFYLGVLVLQNHLNLSPMQSGLAWLPFCIGFFPGLFLFQYINESKGSKNAALIGLILAAIGFILFAIGTPLNNYWIGVMPAMLITSIGFGCVSPVSQYLATIGLDENDSGIGGGITTTIQQLLQVGGVAVLSLAAVSYSSHFDNKSFITQNGFIVAFSLSTCLLILGIIIILIKGRILESSPKSQ